MNEERPDSEGQSRAGFEPQPSLTVTTYNIRYAGLDEGSLDWAHRRGRVAAVLRDIAPDIIAIQECWLDQLDDIADRVPQYDWIGEPDSAGEHTPLGYDSARLAVESCGAFGLAPDGERGVLGWDSALPRTVTHATFRDRKADHHVTVFSVHLDHEGSHARLEGARLIIDRLPDHPTVVAGDLNCTPGTAPYQHLTTVLNDAYDIADSRRGRDETYVGFDRASTDVASTSDPKRIDYVLTDGFEVPRYATGGPSGTDGPASDHLPVTVELRPTAECGGDY